MKDYNDALEWIDKKSKEYGSKNAFLSSNEYRANYSKIQQLHKESIKKHSDAGKRAMSEVGAKPGQKVFYDIVGAWGHAEPQEGKLVIDKNGVPKVKLVGGKTVKWHKGFRPL